MTDGKHTPGPWEYAAGDVIDREGRVIAELYDGNGEPRLGKAARLEADTNGRLIAAAPEMLEALRPLAAEPCHAQMSERVGKHCTMPPDIGSCRSCAARAALVKAEGRET